MFKGVSKDLDAPMRLFERAWELTERKEKGPRDLQPPLRLFGVLGDVREWCKLVLGAKNLRGMSERVTWDLEPPCGLFVKDKRIVLLEECSRGQGGVRLVKGGGFRVLK
jgi:hypothetical protein